LTAPRRSRLSACRGAVAVVAFALALGACDPAPSPTTSGPAGSNGPTAGAQGSSAPGATAVPSVPSRSELIDEELAAGRIDAATAILYRVYAFLGDKRLPAEFAAGAWSPDDGALLDAQSELDTFPPEIRDALLPFLLRPTEEGSWWGIPETAAGGARLASARFDAGPVPRIRSANAAVCTAIGWARADGTAPFTVWAPCGEENEVAAEGAAQIVDALWTPMTQLMGTPIPDENVKGLVGDGRIDIYMTDGCHARDGECLTVPDGALALAQRSDPIRPLGNAHVSSGYIVVPLTFDSFSDIKAALAHELFHVLEFGHNTYEPFEGRNGWFGEASAKWAETYFTKAEAAADTTAWFKQFQSTSRSMASVAGDNEYASFVWPFFMQQEHGAPTVAAAWTALEGKKGTLEMNKAISSVLSIKDRFRDFAVRALNQTLAPGDPINPRFATQDSAVTDGTAPSGQRVRPQIDLKPEIEKTVVNARLPALWASYQRITVDPDVKKVTLSFDGLRPLDAVDVDVLLKIKDKGWERRKLPTSGETSFCRNVPADNVDELWLVLSNHDLNVGTAVTGSYTIKAKKQECGGYSVVYHYTEQWTGGLAGTDLLVTGTIDQDDPEGRVDYLGEGTIVGSQYKGCPFPPYVELGESAPINGRVTFVADSHDGTLDVGSNYDVVELLLTLGGFLETLPTTGPGPWVKSGGATLTGGGLDLRGCGSAGTIGWTLTVTPLGPPPP
jgi:Family of unknown function (DUF6055)